MSAHSGEARSAAHPSPVLPADLVAAAVRGEADALTQVWQVLSPPVLGYLRARGVTEPEDMTSEVFLGVFRRLGSFRGDGVALRTFVFSVAHARYVDEQRRQARRTPTVVLDAELDPRRVPSAESEAMTLLGDRSARELIDTLAPDQRDVLLLRILGDLSLEQTAGVLGKKIGAVKALQHRGLSALRRVVQPAVSP